MNMEQPTRQPTVFEQAASLLDENIAANFERKFGKAIVVGHDVDTSGERPRTIFNFRMVKPGLLPTSLERDWFQGFCQGYKCGIAVLMGLLSPAESEAAN